MSWMATKEDVLRALSKEDAVLLDVRDKEEWVGLSSSPYGESIPDVGGTMLLRNLTHRLPTGKDFCPRKGRLPGAKWLEWYKMHDRKGKVTYTKPVSDVETMIKVMTSSSYFQPFS